MYATASHSPLVGAAWQILFALWWFPPSCPQNQSLQVLPLMAAQEHLNVSVWAAKEGWLVEILF